MFDQEAYDRFLIENNVVGFYENPIPLKSGRLSSWYVNFRSLLIGYEKVDKAAQFIYDFLRERELKPTNVFAVPEGPREFASAVNRILKSDLGDDVSAASLRAGYKTHGSPLDRYSVGPVFPWMKPILIEDVSTTGNSSTEYVMLLQELGISPLSVVSMLNRQEIRNDGKTVEELIKNNYGVPYIAMSDASRVIPLAVGIINPPEFVIDGLREELTDGERYALGIRI